MIEQPVIEYAEAMRAVAAMAAEISRRGKAAVMAVADAHGELIALARMDGARLSSIAIASNKAWTSARSGRPTAEVGAKVRDPQKGFDIAYYGDPRFVGWGGGVPIWKDGRIAGAVAVSGLPEPEDIEVAAMGAGAIAAQ
jgi:glc operon protein GlcG